MFFIVFLFSYLEGLSPQSVTQLNQKVLNACRACKSKGDFDLLFFENSFIKQEMKHYWPHMSQANVHLKRKILLEKIQLYPAQMKDLFANTFSMKKESSYSNKSREDWIDLFFQHPSYYPSLGDLKWLFYHSYFDEVNRYAFLMQETMDSKDLRNLFVQEPQSIPYYFPRLLFLAQEEVIESLIQNPQGWFVIIRSFFDIQGKEERDQLFIQLFQKIWQPTSDNIFSCHQTLSSLLESSMLLIIVEEMLEFEHDFGVLVSLFKICLEQFELTDMKLQASICFLYQKGVWIKLPRRLQLFLNDWKKKNNISIEQWNHEIYLFFNPLKTIQERCNNRHKEGFSWKKIVHMSDNPRQAYLDAIYSPQVSSFIELGLRESVESNFFSFQDKPIESLSLEQLRLLCSQYQQKRWEGRTLVLSNGEDCLCIKFEYKYPTLFNEVYNEDSDCDEDLNYDENDEDFECGEDFSYDTYLQSYNYYEDYNRVEEFSTQQQEVPFFREIETMGVVSQVAKSLNIPFSQKPLGQCLDIELLFPELQNMKRINPSVNIIYQAKESSFHYANQFPYSSSIERACQLTSFLGGFYGLLYTQLVDFDHHQPSGRKWSPLVVLTGKKLGIFLWEEGIRYPNITEESIRDTADVFNNFSLDFLADIHQDQLGPLGTLLSGSSIYYWNVPSQQAFSLFFLYLYGFQEKLLGDESKNELANLLCYLFSFSVALHNKRDPESFFKFFKQSYFYLCQEVCDYLSIIIRKKSCQLTCLGENDMYALSPLLILYFIATDYNILFKIDPDYLIEDIPLIEESQVVSKSLNCDFELSRILQGSQFLLDSSFNKKNDCLISS